MNSTMVGNTQRMGTIQKLFRSKLCLASVLIILSVGSLFSVLVEWKPVPQTPARTNATPLRQLVQRDGRWFRASETNPFTGCMIDFFSSGALRSRSQISNGLLDGLSEVWYTNGLIQVREHFKQGLSQGLRERWHENGNKLSQAMIVDGKVTGTFQSWHDNGQLSEQIELKLGRADGVAWAYYPSGFLKAETTVHDGQVLERKVYTDGERRPSPVP